MSAEYRERLSDRLQILHLRGATATTTDALLLAAALPTVDTPALELGAGCGIVSLLAAVRGRFRSAELCEREEALAALARRNVSENGLADRLHVLHADLRELPRVPRYGLVFANPPYRPAGTGRPAADPLADAARFERAGTVADFCRAAADLLLPDGVFVAVFPTYRRGELETAVRAAGLCPREAVTVYPYPDGAPKILLLTSTRVEGELIERRFTLAEKKGGEPTVAACALYRDGILLTEGEPK